MVSFATGDQGALQTVGLPTAPNLVHAALLAILNRPSRAPIHIGVGELGNGPNGGYDPTIDQPMRLKMPAAVEPFRLPSLPLNTGAAPLIGHPLAGVRRDFGLNQNTSDFGPDLWSDTHRVPYGYDRDLLRRYLMRPRDNRVPFLTNQYAT